MSQPQILLPGDSIPSELLPTSQKRRLTYGIKPHPSPNNNTYTSTTAGLLQVDFRKKTASISSPNARYQPLVGDQVIAQIRGSSLDYFHLHINTFSPQAILNHLSFENASKKSRPQLKTGDLVYAKIISAQKGLEPELTCVNPSTGKPDGMGELKGGMLFDVSVGLAERLLRKEVKIMEELGEKISGGFEIAVGRNGKVWVECPEVGARGVVAVGRCLKEVDGFVLTDKEQKRLVNRVVAEMRLGG